MGVKTDKDIKNALSNEKTVESLFTTRNRYKEIIDEAVWIFLLIRLLRL